MIRTPSWTSIRASRVVILMVIGPLICWLPLLLLDQWSSRHQRPAKIGPTSTQPASGIGLRGEGQPGKRRPANPPSGQARTALAPTSPRQPLKQAGSKAGQASNPSAGASPSASQGAAVVARRPPAKRSAQRPTISLNPGGPVLLRHGQRHTVAGGSGQRGTASHSSSKHGTSKHSDGKRGTGKSSSAGGTKVSTARRPAPARSAQAKPKPAAPLPPAIVSSLKSKAPSGAMLLGNLDLSSLDEKPMLTAARLERAKQLASPDPLSVVPKTLKPTFDATIPAETRVMPAEIVRVPAPHLHTAEQIPLVLQPGGRARGPSTFSSVASQQLVASWLARQPAIASGSVRPVVLKLEPLAPASKPPAAQPRNRASRSPAPRARSSAQAPRRSRRGVAAKSAAPSRSPLPPSAARGETNPSAKGTASTGMEGARMEGGPTATP